MSSRKKKGYLNASFRLFCTTNFEDKFIFLSLKQQNCPSKLILQVNSFFFLTNYVYVIINGELNANLMN